MENLFLIQEDAEKKVIINNNSKSYCEKMLYWETSTISKRKFGTFTFKNKLILEDVKNSWKSRKQKIKEKNQEKISIGK